MTPRIALPSRGRLRDGCLALLDRAGYPVGMFRGSGSRATVGGIEYIEMRPRDAAAWLAAGQLDGAFISTDNAREHDVADWPSVALGFSRSDLVVACRDDAGFGGPDDLDGSTVATHLPALTRHWAQGRNLDITIVAMAGSLEGVCAAGLADAIVDLRETGTSLARNRLRVVAELGSCEAIFSHRVDPAPAVDDLLLRIEAAMAADKMQYVVMHIEKARLGGLRDLFPGLESPTVMPLDGRDDLVAAHIVVDRAALWERLGELRALGATGIVAVPTDAIVA
jgi:ATP phosphoribosyltransferase